MNDQKPIQLVKRIQKMRERKNFQLTHSSDVPINLMVKVCRPVILSVISSVIFTNLNGRLANYLDNSVILIVSSDERETKKRYT